MEGDKVKPVEKFGFKFLLGAGTFLIGGYAFNPKSDDEAEWKSRAKMDPKNFISTVDESEAKKYASMSVADITKAVDQIDDISILHFILDSVTKKGARDAVSSRIETLKEN